MKKLTFLLFFLLVFFSLSFTVFAKESVTYQTKSVKFSGGTRTIKAVFADLNDKNIRVESQFAKNQIGKTDDFEKIVAQAKDSNTEVLAAVNGTFFNSYTDLKPSGTLQIHGSFYHLGSNGSVIAFSTENKVVVEALRTSIKGSINEDWGDAGSWYAWNINSMNESKDSIIIFDPAFGKTTPKHDRTSIIIDNSRVTAIKKGQASIPANGYVIVLMDQNYIKKFHVGDRVDYRIETYKQSGAKKTPIDWSSMATTVGAGPTLLKDGVILANGKSEGFTEDKINTNRGQRSFAGVTKNNILIIGTVSNVNVKELAEICKNLGMVNAINLDGGASSGLYYNGGIVTSPGRKLSNALVVTRVKTVPIRYSFNGREVVSQNSVYVDSSTKELMVPLKDTSSLLFADYSVQGSDITVKRFTKTIKMKLGSNIINVNGRDIPLKSSPTNKNGMVYVPVQAFIEALGGNFSYDSLTGMYKVNVTNYNIPDLYREAVKANTNGDPETAKKLFNQVLSLDPGFTKVYYNLGYLYHKQKNYDEALTNFLLYLKYNPRDASVMSSVAWIYDGKGDTTTAIEYFEKSLAIEPTNSDRWISLGQIYMRNSVEKYDRALQCFENALKNTTDTSKKEKIQNYIKDCKQRRGY